MDVVLSSRICTNEKVSISQQRIYATQATNRLEELYGAAGGSGSRFYLNSIKFQTWLLVASLVVFTSNILPRDIYALTHLDSVQVGSLENLVPEVLVSVVKPKTTWFAML